MPSKQETILTTDSIDRFLSSCVARGRAENTMRAYRSDLSLFLDWTELTEIPMDQYEYLGQRWLNEHRRTAAPKTTGRRLTSIRSYAKWAGYPELLTDYTAPTPSKPIPHPIPEGIDGVVAMIEVAKNYRQRALVALTGLLGCRVSEAISIRPEDIDLDDMTMTVRGKGDKTRVVPVTEGAWVYMHQAFVEAVKEGRETIVGYKDRFARELITAMAARASLKRHVASHDMRATFATAALNGSGDIRAVQEILGHAQVTTTQVYTGVTMTGMRNAAEVLGD